MRDIEREAETQAEGEAGSMHREPDVGLDPGSPGLRPGPKAGAKSLRHPGIPDFGILKDVRRVDMWRFEEVHLDKPQELCTLLDIGPLHLIIWLFPSYILL